MESSPLQNATLLRVVEHIHGGPPIALVELATGEQRYVELSEWKRCTQLEPQCAPMSLSSADHACAIVTSRSSSAEKIALFRSLFKGREDVYALGYRKRDERIAYSPVCRNKFQPGLCAISKGSKRPCATCENLSYAPLTDEVLLAHFKGASPDYKDVVGLYVLREDETCSVLVADFDDDGWTEAANAYRAAARNSGLSVAIERSRSGNGAHAWLFFREPIRAELARRLGFTLLEQALSLSKAVKFSAFDRLFPAQSTLARGGLGNLIALPLQGRAYRKGNSVFVDEAFNPYEDQWRFLSSIEKVDENTVHAIADASPAAPSFCTSSHTPLRASRGPSLFDVADLSTLPPSNGQRAGADAPVREDFPPRLLIRKSNMLYLLQKEISPRGRASLLKLTSFGNPAFYRAQALHLSIRGKPRVICLAEEDEGSIALPRGCEEQLLNLLGKAGTEATVIDERPSHPPIDVSFIGTLREKQQTAADALLAHELGVLSAPTGFGKTVIGAYLIGSIRARTLVIVPSVSLLNQWRARIGEFLDIQEEPREARAKTGRRNRLPASPVGQIGGGKLAPGGVIDIATLQSLVVEGEAPGTKVVNELVHDYDLVIVDECHHGAAPTLEMVLRSLTARRIYGLSATPRRDDGLERIVFMHCGPIRYSISAKDQAREQGFDRLLIPRFTHLRYPALEPGSSFSSVLTSLQENEKRNALIVEDIVSAVRAGRHALVLTKRKEHVELLVQALSERIETVVALTGAGTATQKRERLQRVRDIPYGTPFALVATGSYVGEGFDEPRLDALFIALPISCESVVTQYSGRLHRETSEKRDVLIYDYIDSTVPMLDRMYQRRIKTYAKLGYRIASDGPSEVRGGAGHAIFDRETYWQRLKEDLGSAEREVIIVAPYASEKYVRMFSAILKDAVERGVAVGVWVADSASSRYAENRARARDALAAAGCTVHSCARVASPFAVIDAHLLWYGSLPLLAFPKTDECSLRMDDAELSAEFLARLGEEKSGAE